MKVLALAADDGGCGFYRIRLPALHIPNVTVRQSIRVGRDISGAVRHVDIDADLIVLQRPSTPHLVELIPALQRQGVTVVVELDDDLGHVHPDNPARSPHAAQALTEACRLADLVTCTTPALAKRYGHGHAVVVPNYIPAAWLRIEADRSGVGWSGSVLTHPGDLEATKGQVARAIEDFKVIGTGTGVQQALGLRRPPYATGWLPLDRYPQALATLRIGVVPLADSPFNRAKSALKMLEMAALGVVPITSPTPDNRRLHNLGIGLLAERPADWHRHLNRLQNDARFHAEILAESRNAAATQTIEANAWRFEEAWARARTNAKGRITRW